MPALFASFLAQATNVTATAAGATPEAAPATGMGGISPLLMYPVLAALIYFLFFRPQSQAKKKQEDMLKGVKTGDKVITTSGIHGVITNVKDTTVIVKVADNVKLEMEKTHLDKITRPDSGEAEKTVVTAKS